MQVKVPTDVSVVCSWQTMPVDSEGFWRCVTLRITGFFWTFSIAWYSRKQKTRHPVSETSCFLFYRISDYGNSPKNLVILNANRWRMVSDTVFFFSFCKIRNFQHLALVGVEITKLRKCSTRRAFVCLTNHAYPRHRNSSAPAYWPSHNVQGHVTCCPLYEDIMSCLLCMCKWETILTSKFKNISTRRPWIFTHHERADRRFVGALKITNICRWKPDI
jgi:hypothetical protein